MKTDEQLRHIVSTQLGISEDEITPQSSFADDLGADSLDRVEIVMAAEEAFNLQIDDDVAETLTTFVKLAAHVTAEVARKKGSAA